MRNEDGRPVRARQLGPLLFLLILLPMFLSGNAIPLGQSPKATSPSAATLAGSSNVFPSANSQLFANSQYNLTAGIRAPAINTNFDSANLEITKEGSGYANTSLTPLGTYDATYNFNDCSGGLADGFTYLGTGTSTVKDSYLGHQKVLDVVQANAAMYYVTTNFTAGSNTFSLWVCPVSYTTTNQWELLRASDGLQLVIIQFRAGDYFYYYSGTTATATTIPCLANRWYFVTVVCNFTSAEYQFCVDGSLTRNAGFYTNTGTMEVTSSRFALYSAESYFDALQIHTTTYQEGPGYVYQATDSFTSGVASLSNWTLNDAATTTIQNEVTRHNSMQLYSYLGGDDKYANRTFATPVASTYNVSFWMKTSGTSTMDAYMRLTDNLYTKYACIIHFDYLAFNIYIYDGTSPVLAQAYTINTWYYFSIQIDPTNQKYTVDIDLARRATNYAWITAGSFNASNIQFHQAAGGHERRLWVDAIDLSIDPTFYYKRNYSPVDFFASWPSATDLGQVGIYNAAQSFENETIFTTPTSTLLGTWADASGATCYARVFPAVATQTSYHHNVLCLDDQNAGTAAIATFTLTTAMTSGTIETWLFSTDVTKTNHAVFSLYNTGYGTIGAFTYIASSVLYAYGTAAVNIGAVASNTWVHVRIKFNADTDLFSVWVNGILKSSNQAMNPVADIKRVQYSTGTVANTAFQCYLDALDISSDPSYVSERSTYMFLNSTQSFPSPGAYSFRYQAWGAGVSYDQAWSPFSVTDNVQLNSEADVMTRWTFTDTSTGSWTPLYTANFGTENWGMTSSTGRTFLFAQDVTEDSFVSSTDSGSNYGTYTSLRVQNFDDSDYRGFFGFPTSANYLTANTTGGLFSADRYYTAGQSQNIVMYATSTFDEHAITWNNQPALGASLASFSDPWTAWITFPFASTTYLNNFALESDYYSSGGYLYFSYFYTHESGGQPAILQTNVSKFYQTGGLCYIQTDVTESLTLNSPTFIPLALQSGDRITVVINTTNTNEIDLLLKSSGATVKSFAGDAALVKQDNTNFATQTKTFTLTDSLTIDQLEFSGTFDAEKNIQITNIIIERPTFPSYSFDVGAYTKDTISLSPKNYTLDVLDTGTGTTVLTQSANVTSYTLNKFSYTPLIEGERVILYYESGGKPLDYSLFWTNITRTLDNVTSRFLSTTDRVMVDEESIITIETWDKFGNLLKNTSQTVSNFISITIVDIYSVKIQNQMKYPTQITLSRNYSYSQYLVSNEIVEFQLFAGTYTLNYTQPEIGTSISVSLVVSTSLLYVLNTTARNLYFSAYSGTGLSLTSYILYVNSTRYEWGGPISVLGDYVNVSVVDYYNNSAYSATLASVDGQWYNLLLDVHSFKIVNLMRESTLVQVCNGGAHWDKYVMAGEIVEYVLLAGTYTLNYTNDELDTDVSVNLTVNSAMLYTLNTSFYPVYIGIFSNSLIGIESGAVRLYLDGVRVSWPGPVEVLGDVHNVTALDYGGFVLFQQNVHLASCTEYNLFVNLWTQIFENNFSQAIRFDIYKGNLLLQTREVGSKDSFLFQFADGTYTIDTYYLNGTHTWEPTRTIVLNATTDSKLQSFGIYSENVSIDLKPTIKDYLLILYVIVVVFATILGLYIIKTRNDLAESERQHLRPPKQGRARNATALGEVD